MTPETTEEVLQTAPGRKQVVRKGGVVHKTAGPWSKSVHDFLRHLEREGFYGAPRVAGSGFDDEGRETLIFVEGDIVHPGPWPESALIKMAQLLREFHEASRSFEPDAAAAWQDWFLRQVRFGDLEPDVLTGHCDLGPWNIIWKDGAPDTFIDFEFAGPVDRRVEVAQAAWLCVQVHGDDIAERVGLSSAETRAGLLREFVDAYGLSQKERSQLIQTMIDIAICDAAAYADMFSVTQETRDPTALWGIAWRARSSAFMIENRVMLNEALS